MKKLFLTLMLVFISVGSYAIQLNTDPIQFVKETNIGYNYVVYIDTDIEHPRIYRGLISFLDSLESGDVVVFKITSYGGRGDTTFYIYDAIIRCKAKTIAEINVAMSGGSIIAMACEEMKANKFSSFLAHGPQGRLGGSILDIYKNIRPAIDYYKNLLTVIYKDFLTKDQLKRVLDGEDVLIYEKELKNLIKKWKPVNVKERDYDELKKIKEDKKKELAKKEQKAVSIAQKEADKLEKIFNQMDKILK